VYLTLKPVQELHDGIERKEDRREVWIAGEEVRKTTNIIRR